MTPLFQLRSLGMSYGTVEVLHGIALDFNAGEMAAVVGPNGAGKSTLLSVMAGLRPQYTGECLFHGRQTREWPRRVFAQHTSMVPQSFQVAFPFTAEQVVLMGRTPFSDGLFESDQDHAAVQQAMERTDTSQFRHRDFRSLSGGERQRVILASALAQSPNVLLLDEPTTFLDLRHQLALYALLKDLCRLGLLAVIVTHDLNLAAANAGRIILLKEGRVFADGPPHQVIAPGPIRDVFSVDAQVLSTPSGQPWIHYG
ncbi:MAG: ABC transporter ATP-binding protein [Bryobacteraceae bacterium]